MQIRATTITDFDRRELIVPNKKFITEDVMNWTLSDNVNRVVIEVGVAYGSDITLTRELLIRVAQEHPLVLETPEPSATFDRFADSSLNFTLRCFLPNLDNRLAVIHELHADINREFQTANIEIAFPQQDLHVRSLDVPLHGLLTDQTTTTENAA
jgi:potassium efflux system protein